MWTGKTAADSSPPRSPRPRASRRTTLPRIRTRISRPRPRSPTAAGRFPAAAPGAAVRGSCRPLPRRHTRGPPAVGVVQLPFRVGDRDLDGDTGPAADLDDEPAPP